MSDFLTVYRERLKRNHADLLQLIKDVTEKDSSVETYIHKDKTALINNVVFIKGETINSIWFHEVPYRWSGCGYDEFHKSHSGGENSSMPFDADDVINNFKPIAGVRKSQIENYKSKADYLKWLSYLQMTTTKP